MAPFFPIIYVRGYAMTTGEIAETVSTPYMGFNLGATKLRHDPTGRIQRHIFESPLIRLMKDYGYRDTYLNGTENSKELDPKSIIIFRYYETIEQDLGNRDTFSIMKAARELRELIHKIRTQVCDGKPDLKKQFRVNLVAHSMGGLICRCFLQNDDISTVEDRRFVNKVFTYATPHNGIEFNILESLHRHPGLNVPLGNFNRKNIARYLGLTNSKSVNSLDGKFAPHRFFCLVGTNHKDYDVAWGLSRRLAGEMSDGLVMIKNATVQDAPSAFVNRSHSGPFGIVNSEEGYQNLERFLFGDVLVNGMLDVSNLPLPPLVAAAKERQKSVRVSYYFEASVASRGIYSLKLSERRRDTFSAVLQNRDELLRYPCRLRNLFSVFLDTRNNIRIGQPLVFSVDLAVSTTDYMIDGVLWDGHIEGEYLFRDTLTVKMMRQDAGWVLSYTTNDEWSENARDYAERYYASDNFLVYDIELKSGKPGKEFRATLRLHVTLQGETTPDTEERRGDDGTPQAGTQAGL